MVGAAGAADAGGAVRVAGVDGVAGVEGAVRDAGGAVAGACCAGAGLVTNIAEASKKPRNAPAPWAFESDLIDSLSRLEIHGGARRPQVALCRTRAPFELA